MKYVALLRGVNVGGKNRVPMAELREIAAGLGWTDPATYIASGNLVFDATRTAPRALADALEQAIDDALGVSCRALVLDGRTVREIAAAAPTDWVNDTERKSDVVYLLDGLDPRDALASLAPRDGIDHTVVAPGALIWMVERKNATRSGLQKIVGTPLYGQATVRNVNTARKLATMVGG